MTEGPQIIIAPWEWDRVELLVLAGLPCCWETQFLYEDSTYMCEAIKVWSSLARAEAYFLKLARLGRSGYLARQDAKAYTRAFDVSTETVLAFTCASFHDAWQFDPNCTNTMDLVRQDPDAWRIYEDRSRYLFRTTLSQTLDFTPGGTLWHLTSLRS